MAGYKYSPPRNSQCLCGSGRKYKHCCADHILDPRYNPSETQKLLEEENYREALIGCRVAITQYTILHKSHTEPAIRQGMPKKGSLFEYDYRAMTELVERLLFCHMKAEIGNQLPAVLERLRNNIDDETWGRKVIFFHTIHALGQSWDRDAGRKELRKLGPITKEDDSETAQVYLDLFWKELSFSERLEVIDQILASSEKVSDRLHYKGTKAFIYFTIGDQRKAESELSEVISEVRGAHEDGELSEYARYRLALSLEFLGVLRNEDELLTEALGLYQELLLNTYLTPAGREDLFSKIGEIFRHKEEWKNARIYYLKAQEVMPTSLQCVFLCECYIQEGKLEEAVKALKKAVYEDLTEYEQIDYTFAQAALAIETENKQHLNKAKIALSSQKIEMPYFRERRETFLRAVQEAIDSGASKSLLTRTRKLLADKSRGALSYLIFQPNIMGVGLDIGKMLQDSIKESGSSEQDSKQGKRAND